MLVWPSFCNFFSHVIALLVLLLTAKNFSHALVSLLLQCMCCRREHGHHFYFAYAVSQKTFFFHKVNMEYTSSSILNFHKILCFSSAPRTVLLSSSFHWKGQLSNCFMVACFLRFIFFSYLKSFLSIFGVQKYYKDMAIYDSFILLVILQTLLYFLFIY